MTDASGEQQQAAAPPAKKKKARGNGPEDRSRRGMIRFTFLAVFAWIGICLLATLKFFFPRAIFEPSPRFTIGYPSEFPFGVSTKYQQQHRIWVVRDASGLYVIFAKCTHLGCTPDWKEAENKFKCPCHGSGFDTEGVNFEGPAPRPLDRLYVELAPDGQILVDKSRKFGGMSSDEALEDWKKDGASLVV